MLAACPAKGRIIRPQLQRLPQTLRHALSTLQFCSWEEALPTPESMDSDAAVLHVAKRNTLAMLTGNVCTMDALNLVTERDFDPAKLAEHTLADTAPVSLQASCVIAAAAAWRCSCD